jgi:hypothetical protein
MICYFVSIHSYRPCKGMPMHIVSSIVYTYVERTATHCLAHCHTLSCALPHTATPCCTQPPALLHTTARTVTRCRSAAHCRTATHALPYTTAAHCRTARQPHTATRTRRTLPCALPHTAARTACTAAQIHIHSYVVVLIHNK